MRHHNTDNDHFHIVYNRIDNDLKLISANNDFHRSGAACKRLKERHGLTFGVGKERVNRARLTGADKVKYQIHDEIAACLPHCTTYADLEKRLRQAGISIAYKYRRGTSELPENIQGVSFAKGDYSFKGSQIDRAFSHAGLSKAFDANIDIAVQEFLSGDEMTKQQPEQAAMTVAQSPRPKQVLVPEKSREPEPSTPETSWRQGPSAPPKQADPEAVKREIHAAITANLRDCVLLFDLVERLQQAGIAMHLKYRSGALHSPDNVQGVSFEKDGIVFKGSEIDRSFSHANLTQTLNRNFEKWFRAKVAPDDPAVREKATQIVALSPEPSKPQASERQAQPSPERPATPKPLPPIVIRGVKITAEQEKILHGGGHVWLENMDNKDGSGKFSSHVFLDDERGRVFFSKANPDEFVEYGGYEMRLRDKKQVEFGLPTRAIIRLPGGELAGARLSKENPTDTDYKVLWDDPRLPEDVREKQHQELENRTQRTIATPTNGPKFRR